MTATCHACNRVLVNGEAAWAADWTVIDANGTRTETRYTCDDCEACIPTDPNANADEARDCQGEWSLDVADHLDLDHYTKGASE